jgi:type I restriction enzyme S subunit
MGEWRQTTIGELCDAGLASLQTGPFGSQLHAHDYAEDGIAVVPTEAIRDRRIDDSVLPKITPAKAKELERHRLRRGDILFARRGVQATGHIGCIRDAEDGFICGTGAIRLRIREPNGRVCADFMSHVLANPASVAWFKYHAIGATMPNLNEGIIRSFPFKMPPPQEQRAIASTLSALDDMIDLNRRMNETLEATARAIFKDWFVDFGPTRAKMEGRAPYLAPEMWALFPDRLDDEGKPLGWQKEWLDTLFQITIGRTPPRKEHEHFVAGSLGRTWLSIKTMGDVQIFAFRSEEDLTPEAVARFRVPLVPAGTVMVSFKLTVGRVAIAAHDMHTNEAIAHLVKRPHTSIPTEYTYCFMKAFDYQRLGSTSSIATAVNSGSIKGIEMLVPTASCLDNFSRLAGPLFSMIRTNCEEATNLAATRDILLPKLMSGEIHVKDAQKAVAAVA